MVWSVLCPVVIVAMKKRVTTSTAPVGATVIQGYRAIGVRTVSIYILEFLLLDKDIHGKHTFYHQVIYSKFKVLFYVLFYLHGNNTYWTYFVSECQFGHYGKNCMNTCSKSCLVTNKCNRMTGVCDGGCKPGWAGSTCDQRNGICIHSLSDVFVFLWSIMNGG